MVAEPSQAVLRSRPFLLLWSDQALSQTAQNVLNFVLIVEAGRISSSSTQVSLVVLAFMIPAVIVGPIAGVFVDRFDKRQVLAGTNLLRAAVVFAFMLLVPGHGNGAALLVIYVLSVVFSAVSQFFAPAEAATIPLVVSREQLMPANSLFSLTLTATQVVGFAFVGPLLVKVVDLRTLFSVIAVLYVLCAVLVAFLPSLRHKQEPAAERAKIEFGSIWQEMRELWAFTRQVPTITTAIIDLSVTATIFLMLGTLGVGVVTKVIGLAASDLAYVMAAGGVGVIVGLLAVSKVARRMGADPLVDLGVAMMGAAILAMATLNPVANILLAGLDPTLRGAISIAFFMFLTLILGIGSIFVTVTAQTELQRATPPALRGRVFATFFTVSGALAIAPVLFTGALADLVGLPFVMALIGLATIGLALYSHFSQRRVT